MRAKKKNLAGLCLYKGEEVLFFLEALKSDCSAKKFYMKSHSTLGVQS